MAGVGAEEVEYESDPEEAKLSLTMRRREASDDEEEEKEEIEKGDSKPRRIDDSRVSDIESDGQGAAANYDDDEESEIDEELEEYDDLDEENQYEESKSLGDVKAAKVELSEGGRSVGELVEEKEENDGLNNGGAYLHEDQFGDIVPDGRGEEEKKENAPFAVPTAGAFYMHDDRFGDRARGRHRRTLGGRKLWESKDDKKWGHDKFEEMTIQGRHNEEGRRVSRGRNRGRGKIQGEGRVYQQRGNRSKAFNNNNQNIVPNDQSNVPNNQNNTPYNQNNAPKGVRGRGHRRYQPTWKTYNDEAPPQNKSVGKLEKSSYASSARVSAPSSNAESDQVPARKHVVSSLNSASPPFYPSAASSNKEISLPQKKDESFSLSQSKPMMQGKNVSDSIGMNKLSINDPVPSGGGSSVMSPQSAQSGVHGREQTSLGQMGYQSNAPHHHQGNKISSPAQLHNVQRAPVQARGPASLQAFGQHTGSRTQASSPPESREPPESSKSKAAAIVGKVKGSGQVGGMGSFPYVGTQILGASGNMGSGHGDQNLPFLPVMQFGGQHPGGVGVPAFGMAFPGYVSNPESGNSEMTWLPFLAGPAGALGPAYSPYLSGYGTPSVADISSKESNTSRPASELMPPQMPELSNNESRQRQNKARRYTEMKFDP